ARMLTSANTSRTARSVLEAPIGQPILHFLDLRLAGRRLATKGEGADLVLVEIHFTAYQPARPDLADFPGVAQQAHLALRVGPPQVDQLAARPLLEVQLPVNRERPAAGGRLDPRRPVPSQGPHVSQRPLLKRRQAGVLPACPDPALPPAVVALDHGLEAHL